MADLATRAAMGVDAALRPRVAAAMIGLAIQVISESTLDPDTTPPLERAAQARRRSYALDVTSDVPGHTTRAQWALACWHPSTLPDAYAQGGADSITDQALRETLAAVWTATGGG